MTDEVNRIVFTDDGSINEMTFLLQALGLQGEEALNRLNSGYISASTSAQRMEAAQRLSSAATRAGYDEVVRFDDVIKRLISDEVKRSSTVEAMARFQGLLTIAQREGIEVASQYLASTNAEVAAAAKVSASLEGQATATENLSRLQTNLAAREAERAAAAQEAAVAAGASATATEREAAAVEASNTVNNAAAGVFGRRAAAVNEAAGAQVRYAKTTFDAAAATETEARAVEVLAGATVEGAAGVNKVAAANLRVAETSVEAAAGVRSVGVAGKEVSGSLLGLNGILAGLFAGNELIKASDHYAEIAAQINLVTSSAQDARTAYIALRDGSNQTQTSLEANVKFFTAAKAATQELGVSTADAAKATLGLATTLRLSQAPAQDSYRALRSVSEILSSGEANTNRFALNLKREVPGAFKLIQDSAKELGLEFGESGGEADKAQAKIERLAKKVEDAQKKFDDGGRTVGTYRSEMGAATTVIDGATRRLAALERGQGTAGLSASQLSDAEGALRTQIINGNVARDNAAAGLRRATGAQQDAREETLRGAQAQLAAAKAEAAHGNAAADLIRILEHANDKYRDQVRAMSTVSGAITVLKNNIIDYAGNANSTSVVTTVLKDAIFLLAANVNKVIPAVIALGAVIAAIKFTQLISQTRQLATSLLTLATDRVALAFVAVAAAVLLAVRAYDAWINRGKPAAEQVDHVKLALEGVAGQFGIVTDTSKAMAQSLQETAVAAGTEQGQLTGLTGSLQQAQKATDELYGAKVKEAEAERQAFLARDAAYRARAKQEVDDERMRQLTEQNTKALADQRAAVIAAGGALGTYYSIVDKLSAALQRLYDFAKAVASALGSIGSGGGAGAAAGGGGPGGLPAARSGGTFTVPGSGPVDSRLIAVSPGEVVTVQTPMQRALGVQPAYRGAQTHFASGGVTFGVGVTLGQSISPASLGAGSDVTGYSASGGGSVATLTTAVNDNADAANDNTSATDANTAAVTDLSNTMDTASTPTTVLGGLIGATSGSVADSSSGGSGGSTSSGNTGYRSNPDIDIGSGAYTGGEYNAVAAVSGGSQFKDFKAGDPLYGVSTYDYQTTSLGQNQAGPLNATGHPYDPKTGRQLRDGGSIYVPGGSGVDSRTVDLAVSPGEVIHVETPSQYRRSRDANGGGPVVHAPITVISPDADSFRRSQGQLTQAVGRGLARVARRSR